LGRLRLEAVRGIVREFDAVDISKVIDFQVRLQDAKTATKICSGKLRD